MDILYSQWLSELPKIPQTRSYQHGTVKAPESRNISNMHLKNKIGWRTFFYSRDHFRPRCTVHRRKVKIILRSNKLARGCSPCEQCKVIPSSTPLCNNGAVLDNSECPHRHRWDVKTLQSSPACSDGWTTPVWCPVNAFDSLLQCLLTVKRQTGWRSRRKVGAGVATITYYWFCCHTLVCRKKKSKEKTSMWQDTRQEAHFTEQNTREMPWVSRMSMEMESTPKETTGCFPSSMLGRGSSP